MPKQKQQRTGIKVGGGPSARAASGGSAKKAAKRSGAGAAKKKGAGAGASGAASGEGAAELIERAQVALAYDDYDGALEYLQAAVAAEPRSAEALGALGALLAEVGRADEAAAALRAAAEVEPDEGFEKYMYLAQVSRSWRSWRDLGGMILWEGDMILWRELSSSREGSAFPAVLPSVPVCQLLKSLRSNPSLPVCIM